MEHGLFRNHSNASFTLSKEDHTLANAVRFVLNQDPRVTVAAYSIPHPSLDHVNIRVQTTGGLAKEVLKDACQELMLMSRHARSVFNKVVAEYKVEEEHKKQTCEERLSHQVTCEERLSHQVTCSTTIKPNLEVAEMQRQIMATKITKYNN